MTSVSVAEDALDDLGIRASRGLRCRMVAVWKVCQPSFKTADLRRIERRRMIACC